MWSNVETLGAESFNLAGGIAYPEYMSETGGSAGPKKAKGFNVKLFLLTVVLGVVVVVLLGLFSGASESGLWGWALGGVAVGALFGAILGATVRIADPKTVAEAPEEASETESADSTINSDAAQSPDSPSSGSPSSEI